jgi:hypothetical protein
MFFAKLFNCWIARPWWIRFKLMFWLKLRKVLGTFVSLFWWILRTQEHRIFNYLSVKLILSSRLKRFTRRLTLLSARTRPTPRRPARVERSRGGPPRSWPSRKGRRRSRLPRQNSWPRSKIRRNKYLAIVVSDNYAIKASAFEIHPIKQ